MFFEEDYITILKWYLLNSEPVPNYRSAH